MRLPTLDKFALLREPRYRRAAMTTATSALSSATSMALTFVTTPLLLHRLGAGRFGLLTTLYSLIGIFAFADLGVGNGLMTLLAEKSGLGDLAAARRMITCAMVVLFGLAGAYVLIVAAVVPFAPLAALFHVPPQLASEADWGALTIIGTIILALPLGLASKIQSGYQRGYLSSIADIASRAISLVGVILLVRFKPSVPLIAFAVAGTPVLVSGANLALVFGWQFPKLRPKLSLWSWPEGLLVLRKGGMFVVLQIVLALAFASDNIVITQLLGPAAVARYAVSRTLFQAVSTGSALILLPLWPAYGEALAKGDFQWVSKTLLRSLALTFGLSTIGCTIMALGAGPIYRVWLHSANIPSPALMAGLALWVIAISVGGCLSVLMNAAWAVRFQLVSSLIMCVTALLAKIVLGRLFGLSGVIWGTDLAYIGCSLIPSLIYARRWIVR